MPAAAVIPAPKAYINVVAVKKLVVGFLLRAVGPHFVRVSDSVSASSWGPFLCFVAWAVIKTFTLRKLECSRQASALNMLAWNNNIGSWFYLLVSRAKVMINRDNWGHLY